MAKSPKFIQGTVCRRNAVNPTSVRTILVLLQGVAKWLVSAAESIARERGVSHMYVHVVMDNAAARALYSACGFDVERKESADAARKRQHGRRLLLGKSL